MIKYRPSKIGMGLFLKFNKIHRLLCGIDARFWSGFLGEMPTDIWSKFYTFWLKLAGAKIGIGSVVHYKVKVWYPENIEIGRGVKVPASTDMAGMGKISIGDYTLIGANVSFITNNHPLEDRKANWQEILIGTQQSITVGKFCWLMNDSKLIAGQKGLQVKDYSWIAAGSVVTRDVPETEMWGGSPAKFIRKIRLGNEKKI